MPDQTQGMWPTIWFLPGVPGTAANEFDGYEGGVVGASSNEIMHLNYFADQGPQAKNYIVKSDVTAGYHVYGFQFIPGHSITAYFDGRQAWRLDASSGVTITPEPMRSSSNFKWLGRVQRCGTAPRRVLPARQAWTSQRCVRIPPRSALVGDRFGPGRFTFRAWPMVPSSPNGISTAVISPAQRNDGVPTVS